MLIEVENKIISTELFDQHFVCDLNKCKGNCCIEGDSGAPLNDDDVQSIESNITHIFKQLNNDSINKIKNQGFYQIDQDEEKVTNLMDDGACVFAFKDEQGIYNCAIEKANKLYGLQFIKPLSCHLYPIRTKKFNSYIGLNFDKWSICSPACSLGKEMKIKVYTFLKEPIIRAFGEDFYKELEKIDVELDFNQ